MDNLWKNAKIISLFDNNYTSNIEAVEKIRYLLNICYLYTKFTLFIERGISLKENKVAKIKLYG